TRRTAWTRRARGHRDHALHEPVHQDHLVLHGRRLLYARADGGSRSPKRPGDAPAGRRPDFGRSSVRTADVVIVGGGVTGVSTAFHLIERGVRRVVVLERRFLGAGGTGRSVGILRQLYPTPETTRMVVSSLDVFQNFADAVGGQSGYVSCGA